MIDDFQELQPELDVWYRVERSGKRQLATSRSERPELPAPPKRLSRYCCGLRLRWIDADDG